MQMARETERKRNRELENRAKNWSIANGWMVFLHPSRKGNERKWRKGEKMNCGLRLMFKLNWSVMNLVLNIGFCGDFDSEFPILGAESCIFDSLKSHFDLMRHRWWLITLSFVNVPGCVIFSFFFLFFFIFFFVSQTFWTQHTKLYEDINAMCKWTGKLNFDVLLTGHYFTTDK